MSTLESFLKAGRAFIAAAASTNATCRQEIRDVVGLLSDELDRGLSLADTYLAGARYSADDAALGRYLAEARARISDNLREHQVCAGLYQLADRFEQLFDPVRFSVSIAHLGEIPELIRHLKDGERAVIDDLGAMADDLFDHASRLAHAPADRLDAVRQDLCAALQSHRHDLDQHRKKVRRLRRRVIDRL